MSVPTDSTLPPAEESRHVPGLAIDMKITWTGTISVKKKDGSVVNVKYGPVNANKDLHAVGASYGVYKLLKDKVHWSEDGQ